MKTQEPLQFPDMNTSPTLSPPPTNTMRLSRARTVSPFHEAPLQRQGETNSGKTLVAQVCPVCPDFSTKAPNPFCRGGTRTVGRSPCHRLYLQLLLLLHASETSLVRALGACPRLTLSLQAQEDGAAPTCASRSPCVPGYEGGPAQAPCRLPGGCQMWLRFPGTNPSVCHTPRGLVSGVPEQRGGGHICQGDCVAARDPKCSGPRNALSKRSVCPVPCGEESQWELPGNSLDSTLGPPRTAITHTSPSSDL